MEAPPDGADAARTFAAAAGVPAAADWAVEVRSAPPGGACLRSINGQCRMLSPGCLGSQVIQQDDEPDEFWEWFDAAAM